MPLSQTTTIDLSYFEPNHFYRLRHGGTSKVGIEEGQEFQHLPQAYHIIYLLEILAGGNFVDKVENFLGFALRLLQM